MDLPRIRAAFAGHRPALVQLGERRRAAVAMVLAGEPTAPRVLFIERARHEADPWSGHMAFPGGRVDPGDDDARSAAERETREEVGLDLSRAEPLGRLDDMEGHNAAARQLVISGFVYYLDAPLPAPRPNHEVEEAFWFPLAALHEVEREVLYPVKRAGVRDLPGILVGHPERHIVWGLTHRFLEAFFRVVGRPLPERYDRVAFERLTEGEARS